jgi:hypothetical protein
VIFEATRRGFEGLQNQAEVPVITVNSATESIVSRELSGCVYSVSECQELAKHCLARSFFSFFSAPSVS